jgi:iron complex transport system ATP-binding protein
MLSRGQVYADGPPSEIVSPETLREVFGVEARVMPGPDGIELIIVPMERV